MSPKGNKPARTSRTSRSTGPTKSAPSTTAGPKGPRGAKPAAGGRSAGKPTGKPGIKPTGRPAPFRPGKPAPSAPPTAAPVAAPSHAALKHEDFSVTSCECDACRAACINAPGWFVPQQIPRLAKHLDLSVEETFRRYLAVGVTHLVDGTQRQGVMPHKLRDGKKPGSRWSLGEIAQPGRCVFYDRGRCTIYKVRPDECARMMHDRGDRTLRIRRKIVDKWTDSALAPFLALVAAAKGRR
jgi:Fe-S-cluster containining protein